MVTWADKAQVALVALQLLVLTGAALVAWRHVGEARRLREEQARPFVIVDFDVEQALFYLSVSNIGATLAKNVRIEITPPLTSSIDSLQAKDLKMLGQGVASLAPGTTIRTLFDTAHQRHGKGYPDEYVARVQYQDSTERRSFTESLTLDLGVFWNLTRVDRKGLHEIHGELAAIKKTLESWKASGGGLLRASPDEVAQREKQWRELRARHQQAAATPEDEVNSS
jgi:hypothetical protein